MINTIFLDMDGVLVDFIGGVAQLYGTTGEELERNWPPGRWSVHHALRLEDENAFWHRVDRTPDFWAALLPYPWFQDVIWLAECCCPDNFFIASSPSHHPASSSGKVEWIQHHLGPLFLRYFLTPHKWLLGRPGSLLIDDDPNNCIKFRHMGGEAILFPRPWNSEHQYANNPIARLKEKIKEIK